MASPPFPDFSQLLAGLTRGLTSRRIPFMLIGGQALLLHGHARLTEDIDITLGVDPSHLPIILDFCRELELDVLPEKPADFVAETFVLPARDRATGIRVDFIFSTTEYERQAIGRAVSVPLAGSAVPFATAEDLLIHKLFAGRPRDLEDAASVVRRKGPELDWEYLERWAREFGRIPGREDLPVVLESLRESRGD
ncbi:MAG: nucleotidyl transferase AbiEii/AbiGii toxin family protein [Gemmatimonadales bacterium]